MLNRPSAHARSAAARSSKHVVRRGVLRRNLACRPHGAGAGSRRGQTCPGPGEGVPEGGHPHRGRHAGGYQRGFPAGVDPFPVAEQRGPVGPGRVHRPGAGRTQGQPNYRLVRYADDWCLAVSGTKEHAEALKDEIAGVLATMGLRLSPEKTLVTHIDEGLGFLGWRIQRHRKRGTGKYYVYVYPAKKALAAIKAKIKAWCRQNINLPLKVLLIHLNRMLRGWTAH